MATGGGHPSMSRESEELFKSDCFNCSQEGKHVEAEVYCVECEDNLCMSCLNDHNKIARLRTHEIQRKPVVKDLNFLRLEERNKIQRRHVNEMRILEDTYKAIQNDLRGNLNSALVKNSDLNKELKLLTSLKDRNKTLEEENQNLRKDKDTLQKKSKALKKQNDANMQSNNALEEETQNLRKDKDALQKENEALKGQTDANMIRNNDLEEETQNLRKDKYTLLKENGALKEQNDANMQRNNTLEEETQNLRKDKDALQMEIETVKRQNDANMQRNKTLEEETQNFRKDKDALQKENEALKKQNDANMQRNKTLEEETQNLQKDKDALQKKNEALKRQNDANMQRNNALEEETQNLRKDKDALQEENEALKEQNDANMQRNRTLEEDTQNLRQDKDVLQKENKALKGQHDANMQRTNALEEETQNLRKDKDALQKENEAVKGQNDANMQRNKTLEEETQNLRKSKDALQKEKEALKGENDANMRRNKTLEEETQNLRKDKDALQKENEALKEQINASMHRSCPVMKDSVYSAVHVSDKNIDSSKDKLICNITGICSLDDGSPMIADWNNKCIKKLDNSFQVESRCDLPGLPWDVCQTSSTEVAVTMFYDENIQFVSVGQTMSLARSFTTRGGGDCTGIACNDGKLYVSRNQYESSCCVQVYNMRGSLLQTIQKDKSGSPIFNRPFSIAINARSSNIYVADSYTGLIVLDKSGQLVDKITDPDLDGAWGVCVLPGDQLLVCGFRSHNVIQFDGHGKKVRTLLTAAYGLKKPLTLHFDPGTSRLIVGMENRNTIKVFNLVRK